MAGFVLISSYIQGSTAYDDRAITMVYYDASWPCSVMSYSKDTKNFRKQNQGTEKPQQTKHNLHRRLRATEQRHGTMEDAEEKCIL
jgi:hypothetical protein